MADNTRVINPDVSPGGNTIATEAIENAAGSSIQFQQVKLGHGQRNVDTGDVSRINGLPVELTAYNADTLRDILTELQVISLLLHGLGTGETEMDDPETIRNDINNTLQ